MDQHPTTIHQIPNGMTLIIEQMPAVQSAAFTLKVPAGSIYDPVGENGTAAILTDWITRGAGKHDSRQLIVDLDNLGLHRSESVGTNFITMSGACVATQLKRALPYYASIIREPHLPEAEFEAARMSCEQTLFAVENEPRQKVMVELRRQSFPDRYGRPTDGDLRDIGNISDHNVKSFHERHVHPQDAILTIAGNVDSAEMIAVVEELFSDWNTPATETDLDWESKRPSPHIEHDSTQTHIAMSYNSVPFGHDAYYDAWGAVSILSGGMSSRLFTHVREERGLCYAIGASLSGTKEVGRVMCYAGTTNERAQETLDVTIQEIRRLAEGVTEEELQRAKARAKSSLIMQQESTMSRASSLAKEWFYLGRVTTLSEVEEKISNLTCESIVEYVRQYPADEITLVTIGPSALNLP